MTDAAKTDAAKHSPWVCPSCRSELTPAGETVECSGCSARYAVVAGIPDLRLPGESWIDYEKDAADARRLAALADAGAGVEELLHDLFENRQEWDAKWTELRTRQVLSSPDRLAGEIRGWLGPCLAGPGPFLDLGCGAGTLLVAAARAGHAGIGVDVCLVWLVIARQFLRETGARPVLAAALAESLPLRDGAVTSVLSLDVIEHVADPVPYLREIDRVTAPGGSLALSTPNRFSLAPEPHVGVWGVGWVPRSRQSAYVRWRSGKKYEYVRLLGTWEAERLVERNTDFRADVQLPGVPEDELAHFTGVRAFLGRLYNRLVGSLLLRPVFRAVGPFFHIVGRKPQTHG